MGCGVLPAPEARGSAMVMASEESVFGMGNAPAPGEVASRELTPGSVIASGLSAGLGIAAELSPLDTAMPSCAFRAASFESPAISYTSRGSPHVEDSSPTQSCMSSEYTSIPGFISLCFGRGERSGQALVDGYICGKRCPARNALPVIDARPKFCAPPLPIPRIKKSSPQCESV